MTRRELREHIFRILFCAEFHEASEINEQENLYIDSLSEVSEQDRTYICDKAAAIREKTEAIDAQINEVAVNWQTRRMSKIDLMIIRLAAYEMLYDEDVPTGVAINEAVELAKRYGTDQSPAFVNGILAKLA